MNRRSAIAPASAIALAFAVAAALLLPAGAAFAQDGAKKKPQFTKAPAADLRQPIIWASQCVAPDGTGLAFGGNDQAADDGRPHTRLQIDGQWTPIVEQLRKANPLQADHDAARQIVRDFAAAKARLRFVYFEGQPAAEQLAAAADAIAALEKAAAAAEQLAPGLAKVQGDDYDRQRALRGSQRLVENAQKTLAVIKAIKVKQAIEPDHLNALAAIAVELDQAAESLDAEPPARALSPIVYDARSKLFVLFGGDHLDYMTNDTWVFDPAKRQWRQRHPKTAPPPRANHELAASGDGKVTLSGGFTHNNVDIWYMGPLYQMLDDGQWVYDVAADTWTSQSSAEAVADDIRSYRGREFTPSYFLQGDRPDAAATAAKLKTVPANEWVAMDPPYRPRVNRDWGSACIAGDYDVLLRWSGGHSAHGGSDVPMYHLASNRWELPYPIEFPLGQCYSNTSYPSGFNFNGRPWVSGHTYKNFGYDPAGKLMVFTGHNPWSYLFDPKRGDWIGRSRKPEVMNYAGSFYTLTLCATDSGLYAWGGQYGNNISMCKWDPAQRSWQVLEITGEKLPGPAVDHSGLAFDAKRGRLILLPKKFEGRIFALDLKSNVLSALQPGGDTASAGQISFWREVHYLPESDLLVNVGQTLAGADKNAPAGVVVYDCQANAFKTVRIGGARKAGRDVSLGSGYDAKRKLIWATETNGQVFVLRLDAASARPFGGDNGN